MKAILQEELGGGGGSLSYVGYRHVPHNRITFQGRISSDLPTGCDFVIRSPILLIFNLPENDLKI